ncbi:integrase [Novimethylophilus kurashikiensis]|uniref:Integrase n=1 Tax=Novimethylophilus kurashikiensis TaxID=1825523 RepID=A0A2R5FCA8_9PROT|nr:hypothetical protein [Novimethylophilus kurashikiensis]GBG14274.1 integrase [Novimethylophilus kurashikiensis]
MAVKPTIIGNTGAGRPAPTNLGGLNVQTSPTAPEVKPTVLPSTLPPGPKVEVSASSLPGTPRRPIEATLEELSTALPEASPDALVRIRAILQGVSPQAWNTPAWLNYGVESQEHVTSLLEQRLSVLNQDALRATPQHFLQLKNLLMEVLDALKGGLIRRPGKHGWEKHEGEIRQLAGLLDKASNQLFEVVTQLTDIEARSQEVFLQLNALVLAAEYLVGLLPADKVALVHQRQLALTSSQAMLQEHILSIGNDVHRVQELIGLVQDGALLKLPAVYTQLANLPDKASETQRYLAVDKLDDLVQLFERKHAWLSS